MHIIDGKFWANKIAEELKLKVQDLNKKGIFPTLAIILIGDNPSSEIYVRNKEKKCTEVGIKAIVKRLPIDIEEQEVIDLIKKFNNDEKVHGILLQSPVPNLDEKKLMNLISPKKDVDGFSTVNLGLVASNDEHILAATPKGIIKLLELENIDVASKNVVIVGRSNIVGRPLALALLNRDATVTITHSKTTNLKEITKTADILIVAIGKKNFITEEYVKDGAIVIDVGINRVDNHLYGDVDFENVKNKARAISPVPGGVGPMTIIMLLSNLISLVEDK